MQLKEAFQFFMLNIGVDLGFFNSGGKNATEMTYYLHTNYTSLKCFIYSLLHNLLNVLPYQLIIRSCRQILISVS